jgi:AcrR family transcriptional regulator
MVPMVRRTGADTKQEILIAASRLFSAYGYQGTSLADIAREIGYSKASVLYHFASKEVLLAELIAPAAAEFRALLERVGGLPPAQARRLAVEGYADLTVTYKEAVAILQSEEPLLLQDPQFQAIGVLYEQLLRMLE